MVPQQNSFKKNSFPENSPLFTAIHDIFQHCHDPVSGQDLVTSDSVEGLVFKDGKLSFALKAHPDHEQDYQKLAHDLEKQLKKVAGISDILIVLTAHRKASTAAASLPKKPSQEKLVFPNIRKIIAVASGKGGVGKSTVAVNLAVSMQQSGLRVGLMDADLYGPSIPRMLGLQGQPQLDDDKKMIPPEFHGLKCMSMGFLVVEDTPIIWRGPIVQSSFQQMLAVTNWGELDILIIDLPPGTGDIHLTLIQKVPLSGIVVVSTPQDIALLDARRAIAMFEKLDTPILGIIENMSMYTCPHCQHQAAIFQHGGARQESQQRNLPFLGEIPLDADIGQQAECGVPISLIPHHPSAAIFLSMAKTLKDQLFS